MMGRIQSPQPLLDYVRIDLRSRDINMAKHVLQRPEVSSSFQEVRGKRMPQRMRAKGLVNSRLIQILLDDFP
jgi:hypothetical protein